MRTFAFVAAALCLGAPAFAESGLPVIAIQFLACSGGFCVFCAMVERVMSEKKRKGTILIKNSLVFKVSVVSNKVN